MNNMSFFSEPGGKGLTSTAANHMANLAKQEYMSAEEFIKSVCFVDTSIEVIDSSSRNAHVIGYGMDTAKMEQIRGKLDSIASLKAFCAWVREAIKYKDELVSSVYKRISFNQWLEDKGIKMAEPEEPKMDKKAEQDMSRSELCVYLCNEAYAATFGEFLHPDGPGYEAYAKLLDTEQHPVSVDRNGRDTLITTSTPTIGSEEVNRYFDTLRSTYREYEAAYNRTKTELNDKLAAEQRAEFQEYSARLDDYNRRHSALMKEYSQFLKDEAERLGKLKIVIPDRLMSTFDYLRSLGKDKDVNDSSSADVTV